MDPIPYQEACRQAAHNQGLTPPADILRQHGFKPQVLQTGGMCMVLEAYSDKNVLVWITRESGDGEVEDQDQVCDYLICAYTPNNPEEEGCYSEEPIYNTDKFITLSDIPAAVQKYSQGDFTR